MRLRKKNICRLFFYLEKHIIIAGKSKSVMEQIENFTVKYPINKFREFLKITSC